jgi:DNA adenine methylase
VRPFLKWAGGKRQLLPQLRRFVPPTFGDYHEPFVGSGALFFDLSAARHLSSRAAYLIDTNADLVGCYQAVAWHVDE